MKNEVSECILRGRQFVGIYAYVNLRCQRSRWRWWKWWFVQYVIRKIQIRLDFRWPRCDSVNDNWEYIAIHFNRVIFPSENCCSSNQNPNFWKIQSYRFEFSVFGVCLCCCCWRCCHYVQLSNELRWRWILSGALSANGIIWQSARRHKIQEENIGTHRASESVKSALSVMQ